MPFEQGSNGNYPTPHWPSLFAAIVCAFAIYGLATLIGHLLPG